MARTNFTKKVQRQAIERAAGQCEGLLPSGERCPCELQPGRFQVDHILMDALGGPAILANAQVLCTDCHKLKTDKDKARLAKAKRQSDAHNGVVDPRSRPMASGRPLDGGRPLPGAAPAHRATAPLTKALPPRRALYTPEPR
ncbi:HNH endonuclease [Methylobacterium currus]|uniref:HNH endonuclease n=1 Tax=Methylobacterium currus TaxID=2051553 RepID=A0A2R4WI30_9HYPH|nr:HNH endonuclease signature motif containing protein [Methylobacterium currus]AWB21204.1 HNH endonuclease [Methylobacterium currus]